MKGVALLLLFCLLVAGAKEELQQGKTLDSVLVEIDKYKEMLDALRPLILPVLLEKFQHHKALEFTYHSNALEGNTLDLSETRFVVEEGITVGGKTLREHNEAVTHFEAVKYIMTLVGSKKLYQEEEILKIHKILLTGVHNDWAGLYRNGRVTITGSSIQPPPHHSRLLHEMGAFMQWLHTTTAHPVLVAAEAHYRLVCIHPFADGNGRTSRLVMNLLLLQEGYPLTVLKAKEHRVAYLQALRAADAGDKEVFFTFVAKAVLCAIQEYLEHLTPEPLFHDEL